MKISFLIHDAYGVGGTIRTVLNLATALSARHEVEVVSVYRRSDRPMLPAAKVVKVVPLVDTRSGSSDRRSKLLREPSAAVPWCEQYYRRYNALTDQRIAKYLRSCRADVVLATRPSLNICLAMLGRGRSLQVAQEHMDLSQMPPDLHGHLRESYCALDATVTVTEAEAARFRALLTGTGVPATCIPNSVPRPLVPPSHCQNRVVAAAGRLVWNKRFDVLVRAFHQVAALMPEWSLRIYGDGSQRRPLRALIDDLDLYDRVLLMGRRPGLDAEWATASIGVASSEVEPFGMTLVEAMRCGLPMVSTACQSGPPEIIADGEDGFLTPVNDTDALAGALLRLMRDDDKRKRMGHAAYRNAQRFDPSVIAARYESFLLDLLPPTGRRAGRPPTRGRPAHAAPAGLDKQRWWTRLAGRMGLLAEPEAVVDCVARRCAEVRFILPVGAEGRVVLRERAAGREVRLRISGPPTGNGRPHATLPCGALGEGRWNVYLESPRGRRRRLHAGLLDLRELAARRTTPLAEEVRHQLPYRTADGHLSVRAWARLVHYEVDALHYRDGDLLLDCLPFGASQLSEHTWLTLRRANHELPLRVPGTRRSGGTIRFVVPAGRVAWLRRHRRDEFALYVASAGHGAVRVGRFLDDIVERSKWHPYPAMRVPDTDRVADPDWSFEQHPATQVKIVPQYTADGELSLRVIDA